jgi:hypothetical protein
VLANWPLGSELPGGFRWLLAESATDIAPRRLAVAMCGIAMLMVLIVAAIHAAKSEVCIFILCR